MGLHRLSGKDVETRGVADRVYAAGGSDVGVG